MNTSIVAPLLVFCSHAISMRDGRCCGVVLRVFRSIIPEFSETTIPRDPDHTAPLDDFPIPEETASQIREFISTEVLKAAISSLHDPYFVDLQKELCSLIAHILVHYSPLTPTPRNILASLPNIKESDIDRTIDYISRPGLHGRQQRAIVLDLLEDLKGVSISEMGKLSKSLGGIPGSSSRGKKPIRSKMQQEFMTPNGGAGVVGATGGGGNHPGHDRNQSPDLEGVAGMFNEAG
jgi:exportin-5